MTAPRPRLRASTVCLAEGHLLLVRLRDPVSGELAVYPPGGAIEPGEAPADAARRETLEETGLTVAIDRAGFVTEYPFTWAGELRAITTHWFRASLAGPFTLELSPVADADYHLGALWMPVDQALTALAVHPAIAAAVARALGR